MKPFATLLLTTAVAATLAACQKPGAATTSVDEHQARPAGGEAKTEGAGEAVQLKEGHGLALHPKIREAIKLQVAEVSEEAIAPEFKTDLHVIQGADTGLRRVALTPGSADVEANGWVSADKAARIQPGQEVELRVNGSGVEKGVVKRVEKSPYATLGDFEVVVTTDAPLDTGTRLSATFRAPAGDPVPAVPRSALLQTAEGWFVYAVNESFFLRTPVKVGAMNGQFAEIAEGLYAGDQIVTSPVNSLWMSELQILRGGKSCTCGH
jgi:hypothetical protein